MLLIDRFAHNGHTFIHYYDSIDRADKELTPLVVCPGLSETAEEYLDLIEAAAPRRCMVLSFRGRGKSDTPESGYDLEDHVADLEAVIQHAGVTGFHLFAFSRGVSYAIRYVNKHEEQVRSLGIGDYPAEHRAMPGWANGYINHYLIPFSRTDNIREAAVWGIERDSRQSELHQPLHLPVLVVRGKLEGSLILDSDLDRYRQICTRITVKEYDNAGHDLRNTTREQLHADVLQFVAPLG